MKQLHIVVLLCVFALVYGSLTDLYNSDVDYAEYYIRALSYAPSGSYSRKKRSGNHHIYHAGVVVTTGDDRRWLIHKGGGFGSTWDTVITDARHMSSRWTRVKCGNVNGYTVNDFMRAGNIGSSYCTFRNNCQHAANAMWELVHDTVC